MRRVIALLLLPLLVGCNWGKPTPAPPPKPIPAPAPPAVIEPGARCHQSGVGISVGVGIGASVLYVTQESCSLTVPAGLITLDMILIPETQQIPIEVEGAPPGQVTEGRFHTETTVAEGETKAVTLKVQGKEPITYTLVGTAPIAGPFLSSGPSKEGPWTPVTAGGLLPESTTWLQIQYPRPMKSGQPAPYSPDQYAEPSAGLTGEWVGEQRQLVALAAQPRILFGGRDRADKEGLTLTLWAPNQLYRGAPPELLAVKPDGTERSLRAFDAEPAYLTGNATAFSYHLTAKGWFEYLVATNGQRSVPQPTRAWRSIPSPDGKLVAELRFPEGQGPHPTEGRSVKGDLVIMEQGTFKVLLEQKGWLTSFGAYSCNQGRPGFGWRQDSKAFAALDTPEPDRLVLKEGTLTGESRTIAEQRAKGVGWNQWFAEVNWSPDGKQIVFAGQVVQAADGKLLAEGVREFSYWSPDSRYLLEYGRRHSFTQWGPAAILEVATKQLQPLGNGHPLGWNQAGEALWIRWEVEKETPAPGKGCP